MTETGCLKPQEMNAQNVGIACLKISSRWYLSHIRTFLRYAYQSGNTDRDYSGIVPLFKIPQPYPSVYTAEEIQKLKTALIRVLHTESGIMQHCSLQHGWGSGVGTFHP